MSLRLLTLLFSSNATTVVALILTTAEKLSKLPFIGVTWCSISCRGHVWLMPTQCGDILRLGSPIKWCRHIDEDHVAFELAGRHLVEHFTARGFQEVETPMLQPQAGGAAARPFITHYNALDCEMFMRIAPELYLKRLLVGGFDKIFEMNRNFRNEGLDRTHNPEFTVLEVYEAYGDRTTMKRIIEEMLPHICRTVLGTMVVESSETGERIDFTPPYREVAYGDLVREAMGDDWFDLDAAAARASAEAAGVAIDPAWDHLLITHEVYDKLIEKRLRQPTFVTRVPRAFIPLAKACADDPSLADVFEFVVAGKELCPGYTEQNDPFEQRKAFEAQAGEEKEKIDEDFITALEHGMPPAGGLGLGIDRLVMLLTGTEAIRDVILFPQLKMREP